MNTLRIYLLIATLGIFGMSSRAFSQEVSSTASFIAMQCSASSGYPAEGYYSYAEDLVQTLSALSPEAQSRVLGYELNTVHDAVNKNGNTNNSGGAGPNNTLIEEADPSLLDKILSVVGL